MKCFNCECEIVDTELSVCTNCAAKINTTKTNFISYIGSPDSLAGYQKSYKLLLLKYIIEAILEEHEATVSRVIPAIKDYYLARKKAGLPPDYDVDARITEIKNTSDYDVFAVIKNQPFKVINEKGYLFLNRNTDGKLVFVFNDDLSATITNDEWRKLLSIINAKLDLYYNRYDSINNVHATTTESATISETSGAPSKATEAKTRVKDVDLSLSVLEIANLSVRAKNVLMRNKLYTIGDVVNYIQDNDLRSLKNMGQKTFEEITSLLQSADFQITSTPNTDEISSLFTDNKYHLFVEFCTKNGITTLSDLEGFDFSLLLNEPRFGISKVNAIQEKYYDLLQKLGTVCNPSGDTENVVKKDPDIIIDPSNIDLGIPCLRFAGISAKNNAKFYEKGYSKIGQLNDITLGKLIRMFGRTKGPNIFEKIKIFEKPLLTIATERLNSHKGTREFDIYIDRANKKTLQEIADTYALSRERVRQIETKFFREFTPLFGALVDQHMTQNGLYYITTQDVLEFFDDDSFDTVIMYTLKESYYLEYLSFADMFIKKKSETQDTTEQLRRLTVNFVGEDGINFFESLTQIEEMLNAADLGFISAEAYLNFLIESGAHFYGDLVFLRKQSYARLCLMLIGKYFKDGITLSSDDEMNQLRKLFHDEFGDYDLPENNRAISARLSEFLILCDRGKAKLIENINFDQSVIEDIKKYIDTSPLKTLYFIEIFNEFEGILTFTSDITNYHGLHGLLAYLYRDEYEFTRDYLTKLNEEGISLSLSERIDMFISNKGRAVTRDEIKGEIRGLSDIMLFNAINNSDSLLQWDYNSLNSLNNLTIETNDKDILSDILEDIFSRFRGYCSDRLVFEETTKQYPKFMSTNGISNPTNLFYVLQRVFGNTYRFSRPHICKNNLIDTINTKNIALYLLNTTQYISRRNFVKIAKDVRWSETTADLIFYELEKDYIRISEDIYIVSTDFNINDDVLYEVATWLNTKTSTQGFLSMIGYNDFEGLPEIEYEWNSFLFVSIIKKHDIGFKLVSPAIKDRRYNKEIVVPQASSYNNLDDIVYDLLKKTGMNFIDESNLLSFLVINRLVSKIIPKELMDSKILNYSDGYFKIT